MKDRVYALVRSIPKGHVTTYGAIAAKLGNPGLARAVGNALHKNNDPMETPCWRVVNARGGLASHFGIGGPAMQEAFLREDGIPVEEGRVDLAKYGYWFN